MIVLVSLIVLLRRLLVPIVFRMVHPYITIHSFLHLYIIYYICRLTRRRIKVADPHTYLTSAKIIQLNEWGCRDAPCKKSWKQSNPLSNTIKDTSTIMRNPFAFN